MSEPVDGILSLFLGNFAVEAETRYRFGLESGLDNIECGPPG